MLLAEDKLRLLSLAKSKISAIINNVTTEIWLDVDELKIAFTSLHFSHFNQSKQCLVKKARICHMSAKLITYQMPPVAGGIIENDYSSFLQHSGIFQTSYIL